MAITSLNCCTHFHSWSFPLASFSSLVRLDGLNYLNIFSSHRWSLRPSHFISSTCQISPLFWTFLSLWSPLICFKTLYETLTSKTLSSRVVEAERCIMRWKWALLVTATPQDCTFTFFNRLTRGFGIIVMVKCMNCALADSQIHTYILFVHSNEAFGLVWFILMERLCMV